LSSSAAVSAFFSLLDSLFISFLGVVIIFSLATKIKAKYTEEVNKIHGFPTWWETRGIQYAGRSKRKLEMEIKSNGIITIKLQGNTKNSTYYQLTTLVRDMLTVILLKKVS